MKLSFSIIIIFLYGIKASVTHFFYSQFFFLFFLGMATTPVAKEPTSTSITPFTLSNKPDFSNRVLVIINVVTQSLIKLAEITYFL